MGMAADAVFHRNSWVRWPGSSLLFGICIPCHQHVHVRQVLLTLGLQRETAGRGTIAVYGQVSRRSIVYAHPDTLVCTDRVRDYIRAPVSPHIAICLVRRRDPDHIRGGAICCGTFQ